MEHTLSSDRVMIAAAPRARAERSTRCVSRAGTTIRLTTCPTTNALATVSTPNA